MGGSTVAYRLNFAVAALRGGISVARVMLVSVSGLLRRQRERWHAGARHGLAAFARHRHGTWLLLFCALFTLLWLLAGWVGMGNGVWRGILVGIATPVAVSALFPLRRVSLQPSGCR